MIAIVLFNDLRLCQFLYKYTAVLDINKIDYTVIYWNRSAVEYSDYGFSGKVIEFSYKTDTYQSFSKKIYAFIKYAKFMRKTIKKNSYQKLIVLTSQTAVSLRGILIGRYKGKYIYDYRDITKEPKSRIYRKMIIKIIDNAKFFMFSSPGFIDYLKINVNSNYCFVHNSQMEDYKKDFLNIKKNLPINIVYWGMIRQIDYNKKICDLFGNDERFNLKFHGDGHYPILNEYCFNHGYNNIEFTGKYDFKKDISTFSGETDILNCLYENDECTRPTLAVKLYDAIRYRIPILVNKNSYLSYYLKNNRFALDLNVEEKENCKDEIISWYLSLDKSIINKDFDYMEKKIITDDCLFKNIVLEFVRNQDDSKVNENR